MTDIQAVILADSYQTKFNPISSDIPKILFPFGNEPLIERILGWLVVNGIHEIFILYQSQQEQVEQYFSNRKKSKKTTLKLIHTLESRNMGDALRELYSHKVIQQDFILIPGDIVTNVTLYEPIKKYQENKEKNKLNIALMITHKEKPYYDEERYLYTLRDNYQLVQLDDLNNKAKIKFSKEKFALKKGIPSKIQILSNLIESGIYICSRDVLKGFQENFVYADLKDDFIREMLNSEIQEEKIHIFITPKEQTSIRIHHPNAYYLAYQRYLARYYSAPENAEIVYEDFFKYIGVGSKIDTTVVLSELSYVSAGCEIGSNSKINKSVIGKYCQIGKNAEIYNSIIWQNVTIEDNVIIKDSLIANNVVIGADSIIGSGSIISQNTIIQRNSKIVENSKIKHVDNQPYSQYFTDGKQGESMGEKNQYQFKQSEKIDQESDGDSVSNTPKKQQIEAGLNEDIILLLSTCDDTEESIQQAIINVETLKVNKNRSFEEIIEAFLPEFCKQLNPDLNQLKIKFDLWKDFINRFVSESECQCYLNQLEQFCRKNPQFYLHQLLQLSYQNQTLSEKDLIEFSKEMINKDDEFSKKFVELNANFLIYLEQQLEQLQYDDEYEYEYQYEEEQTEEQTKEQTEEQNV